MEQSSQTRAARTAFSLLVVAAAVAGCAAESGNPMSPIVIPNGQAQAGAAPNGMGGTGSQPQTMNMNPPNTLPMGGTGVNTMVPPTNAGTAMPCEVETVVKTGCQGCHGGTPIGGAPMSLLTVADFQKDYMVKTTTQMRGQTMKMYELARIRVNKEMGTSAMPQGQVLAPTAFATLDGWLRGGAKAGTACAAPMNNAGTGAPAAGAGGTGAVDVPGKVSECDTPGAFDPLVANAEEGETCWNFLTHNLSTPGDTTKFQVPVDESYSQLYYDIPWGDDQVATRFGSDFDNLQVLHHWLMFSSTGGPAGTVSKNVTGTTLGENTELVAGWAVGGCTTTYPKDVGVKLPSKSNRKIMIQWHHYNSTGSTQADGSIVQICTVAASKRQHLAGLTFLGGESMLLGPGKTDYTTSCMNDSGMPITIIGFTPHMHTLGVNMKSVVGSETVFDKPFVFDQQVNYMLKTPYVLAPGATITSTCTYENDTGFLVTFGQPTSSEMCYQFALAYPYGALNNGVPSLIGASNTCW